MRPVVTERESGSGGVNPPTLVDRLRRGQFRDVFLAATLLYTTFPLTAAKGTCSSDGDGAEHRFAFARARLSRTSALC
jgi:hypothetical protein